MEAMYKLLLCWRYLRTRYIAIASIISVMLGVAAMIIVNSVMAGFARDMQGRIKGIICDVVLESATMEGMRDFDWHAEQIRKIAGDQVEDMTPICFVPAMLSYRWHGTWVTNQVNVIGIDEKSQGRVSDFAKYLQHPENRRAFSFNLRPNGYDVYDHLAEGKTRPREAMANAGWPHRIQVAQELLQQEKLIRDSQGENPPGPLNPSGSSAAPTPSNPFDRRPPVPDQVKQFDMAKEQCTGVVLGIAQASFRTKDGEEHFRVLPGDDIQLSFPTAGAPPKIASDKFTVVDFYESKMLEYDQTFVFMPIKELQKQRGMVEMGVGYVNAIEIKLKPGVDGDAVRDKLRAAFAPGLYHVETWRDKQGALLAAVQMETTLLNILLFLIIAVAGFGILAIFFMIVVEKTRDIGILKSLGASGRGVMGIFLTYGLSLGLVGSGVGLIGGLLFVHYINNVADLIGWVTGRPVFNPEVYYLYKIPTVVYPETVAWIVAGALGIAMLASVLPALRAARLHPVEALRYE
jgi:lipoprotein-releasing system permease protein